MVWTWWPYYSEEDCWCRWELASLLVHLDCNLLCMFKVYYDSWNIEIICSKLWFMRHWNYCCAIFVNLKSCKCILETDAWKLSIWVSVNCCSNVCNDTLNWRGLIFLFPSLTELLALNGDKAGGVVGFVGNGSYSRKLFALNPLWSPVLIPKIARDLSHQPLVSGFNFTKRNCGNENKRIKKHADRAASTTTLKF